MFLWHKYISLKLLAIYIIIIYTGANTIMVIIGYINNLAKYLLAALLSVIFFRFTNVMIMNIVLSNKHRAIGIKKRHKAHSGYM